MSVLFLYDIGRKIYNKNTMKRRFIVTYYEYGLTRRIAMRFFFRLSAYLYKGWLEYQGITQIEIYEDYE